MLILINSKCKLKTQTKHDTKKTEPDDKLRLLINFLLSRFHDLFDREAVFLVEDIGRCGGAEGIDTDDLSFVTGVFVPAEC